MFKKVRNMKLKDQFMLLTGAFALFTVLLGIYVFYNLNDILTKKITSSTGQVFDHIETEILNYFDDIENTSYTLSLLPSTQKLLNLQSPQVEYELYKDLYSYLINLYTMNETIVGFSLQMNYKIFNFNLFNIYLGDTRNIKIERTQKHMTKLLSYWNSNTVSNNNSENKKQFYALIQPLCNTDAVSSGKFIGNIAMLLNKSYFDKICSRDSLTNKSMIYIINNYNEIVGSRNSDLSNAMEALVLSYNGSGEQPFICNHDKIKYLLHIRFIGSTGWRIISVTPYYEYFRELNTVKFVTVTLLFLILMLIIIISMLITRNITIPIKQLLSTMESVGKGNLKEKCPVDYKNEIGSLSHYFNYMMDEVYSLTQKIFSNQSALYEMELANKDARLLALQSQINPHFLYNTLATMQSIALHYKVTEISEISKALARIFRYSIKESDFVLVSAELENINNYILIQQVKSKEKFKCEIEIMPELLNYKIIKLILQPIVENAINHGIMRKVGRCVLSIRGYKINEKICFEISDNGIGMPPEQVEELNSLKYDHLGDGNKRNIGITNVKQRLNLCYGDRYTFNIKSNTQTGTEVFISIPFEEAQNDTNVCCR